MLYFGFFLSLAVVLAGLIKLIYREIIYKNFIDFYIVVIEILKARFLIFWWGMDWPGYLYGPITYRVH